MPLDAAVPPLRTRTLAQPIPASRHRLNPALQPAVGSAAKRCSKCGETKERLLFSRDKNRADGRNPACRLCEAARGRKYSLKDFPSLVGLGATTAPGSVRRLALDRGRHSGSELELEERFKAMNIDVEYENYAFYYADDAGERCRWTPDFGSPSGAVIEAKGKLFAVARRAIESVMKAYPHLDVRFVFQQPHCAGQVEGTSLTLAEWAESHGRLWTTKDRLEVITSDLPRIRLTSEGDRIIPGYNDEQPNGEPWV
jgi:hypothetical protein